MRQWLLLFLVLNSGGTEACYHLMQDWPYLETLGFRPDGYYAAARIGVSLLVGWFWNFLHSAPPAAESQGARPSHANSAKPRLRSTHDAACEDAPERRNEKNSESLWAMSERSFFIFPIVDTCGGRFFAPHGSSQN